MQQFQYTHPARGATGLAAVVNPDGSYFNPRTPRGVRLTHSFSSDGSSGFQSKHPARGATCSYCKHGPINGDFNPRTPRGVRPPPICSDCSCNYNFNPRTPRGVRRLAEEEHKTSAEFQSTHPARGATCDHRPGHDTTYHFNPRTPRGVRRMAAQILRGFSIISIHTPREGCDRLGCCDKIPCLPFQSTHPARGATGLPVHQYRHTANFNPRTPRGVRPDTAYRPPRCTYFNPRTPRGVRPLHRSGGGSCWEFQSTHPARGATAPPPPPAPGCSISIHAPREGCDAS